MKVSLNSLLRACLVSAFVLGISACSDTSNNNDNGSVEEEITVRSLPWVSAQDFRLVDDLGREISVRGINARIEGLFDVTFDDGRTALEPIPEFTREDAQAMVYQGFNVLRLPINWSGMEPHEGQFSQAYFEKLDEVIQLSREAGLYVLLDFHQDAWSKEIGEDGAPLWAIVPPPEELLEGPLEDLGERRFSAQVLAAFQGFFENTEGIQDRFLPVWKHLIGRYAAHPEVIGFEPMNEPFVSHFDPSQQSLYDFYYKLLPAMRELDNRHMLWMEPGVIRNYGISAPLLAEPFPDSNIVYCPHIYPLGIDATSYEDWQTWLATNFSNMRKEANSWGGALVLGEWGTHPDSPESEPYIQAMQEAADEFGSGQILWLWKEDSQGSWGFYDFDTASNSWVLRDSAARLFSKPYAQAVPGKLLTHNFDPQTKVLEFSFEATGNERAGVLLYLPELWFDGLPTILVNGSTIGYERDSSSQRALLDFDIQPGTYSIEVY
ncbi:Uncharacterised protein [Halioglobus japonicus]|nr:Uncharacterised protein [Halioglobus japonicus]